MCYKRRYKRLKIFVTFHLSTFESYIKQLLKTLKIVFTNISALKGLYISSYMSNFLNFNFNTVFHECKVLIEKVIKYFIPKKEIFIKFWKIFYELYNEIFTKYNNQYIL